MAQAPLVPGALPLGYCYPSSAQQFVNDIFAIAYANVPDNVAGVEFGPTAPDNDPQLWYSTTQHRLFEFNDGYGLYIARYWPDPDPEIKMITEKTEAEIKAWDNPSGDDATAGATDYTGPFWEIDHNYDGRFIVAPGEFPVIARTVALSAAGGLDAVVQGPDEVGLHRHFITMKTEAGASSSLGPQPTEAGRFAVGGGNSLQFANDSDVLVGQTRVGGGDGEDPSVVQPTDNIPPYRAAWVVKRTTRIYYTP